jgi:cysteine synthase B
MSNLTELVGKTPMVLLDTIQVKPNVQLLAKLEGNNPGGSVKDRAALFMIEEAEKRGELKPGMKLIEATSGNTGIALAMIAGVKGYEIELVMPENSTKERVLTMRGYGAKVTLTPAEQSMEGAIDYAHRQVAKGGVLMLDQFSNSANPLSHYLGTAPEIWSDTDGKMTHFVSAMGTTGTIMGVSRFIKEQNSGVQIVGCQPTEGSRIPGIRRWPVEYLPKIYDPSRVDRIIDVEESDAREITKRLAREEGVFCGMSAGGAVWGALQIAKEIDSGCIVVIIPDRGDRYLSSGLFG